MTLSEYERKGAYHYEWFERERWYRQHVYLVVALTMGEGDRILDVGCGDGVVLSKLGSQAVGVDLSAEAVRLCKERNLDAIVADARSLPFGGGVFDCVVASEMIEHLSLGGALQALGEIHRILKEGGCLVLTTPNLSNPYLRLMTDIGHRDANHEREYDNHGITELLDAGGFTVEKLFNETAIPMQKLKFLKIPECITYAKARKKEGD